MPIILGFAAFAATLAGGLFALRAKDKLHLVLGFSAGAVIGVAFFDLLPEAIGLGGASLSPSSITALAALGFLLYLFFDRLTDFHAECGEDGHGHAPARGTMGALALSLHSFLDGAAIGLAFQVSPAVGAVVAVAVLVHDFSDGVNTVGLALRGGHGDSSSRALRLLTLDAVAPILGVLSTYLFALPESALAATLALFAGFFLYIGASDLVPESHHAHPKLATTVMTALGLGVMFVAIRLAGL